MTVSKEVRDGLQTVFLPPIETVVEGVDLTEITDEQDIQYNAWCTAKIKQALLDKRAENQKRIDNIRSGATGRMSEEAQAEAIKSLEVPMLRTRYPKDDFESEDVVSLNNDDEVVVLDTGTR